MRRGRASSSEETEGIWAEEGVVRKISSTQVCLIFAMVGDSGQGSVAPVLASESARSFPGSQA